MVPRWQVSDLAEDYFDELRDEGVTLSPQEVLDIQRLSLVASGDTDEERIRLSRGAPVLVGGAYLYPLTFAAVEWEEAAEHLFRRDSWRVLLMAAAMAYGHDREKMATRGEDARRIVEDFRKGLAASITEVEEAVRLVTGEVPVGEPPEEEGRSNIVCVAAAMTGIAPDVLEHDVSIHYLAALVAEAADANARAAGGQVVDNRKFEGLRQLEKYVQDLRRRHAEEKDHG